MSTLAAKLLNNPGLIALTVEAEQKELAVIKKPGRKIKFVHFQSDFQGGHIPYWDVMDPSHPSYGSTLSMEGLHRWNVI